MEAEEKWTMFLKWISECRPDFVSKVVLSRLFDEYLKGNPMALFGKMLQLTNYELYGLCQVFKSMFDYVGINEEYKNWVNQH